MKIPPFCYRQTPFLLLVPFSIVVLSSLTLFQGSGLTRLQTLKPVPWALQWIAISTPWVLLGIGILWLLAMLLGKEYTFQKIESDGKRISFKTNRYQGSVTVEEIEKFWLSDQRDWIVLYFLFRTSQIAERLHLKPNEIEQNLQDFFAHHILGLPKQAFPRDFQRSDYPNPKDILSTQEEGIQNWMIFFRIALLGFLGLYLFLIPWKPEAVPYFSALALGIFWFALRAYPLVRVKKWGFFKIDPEQLLFFQTLPLFAVSRNASYEKEASGNGTIRTQFEPDTVKWLQTAPPIAQQYALTHALWQTNEFSRFQKCFSTPSPSSLESEKEAEDEI